MVQTYSDLMSVLREKYDEYNKEAKEVENGFYEADYKAAKVSEIKGKAKKLSDIGKKLREIKEEANPKVFNSSTVLHDLHSEILDFVFHYKMVDDIFELGVDRDGFVQIAHTSPTYENSDGKKCKDYRYITYGLEGTEKKYIEITKKTGTAREETEKGTTEVDMRYIKHIYTTEGLDIQGTEAKKVESYPENFDSVKISKKLSDNAPQYSIIGGYSPRDYSTKYDMMSCCTRGTDFGDGKNIGICKIIETDGDKHKTFIEPIDILADGPYIGTRHTDGVGVEIDYSTNGSEKEKEAIKKWGGEKAWSSLVSARKYREYPDTLLEYAQNKCKEIEMRKRAQYVINGNNLDEVAKKQKASEVNSRTASLRGAIQPQQSQQKEGPSQE